MCDVNCLPRLTVYKELKYDNCWPLVVYSMARDTYYTDMQTNTFVDLNINVCEIRRLAKSFAASWNNSCIDNM